MYFAWVRCSRNNWYLAYPEENQFSGEQYGLVFVKDGISEERSAK